MSCGDRPEGIWVAVPLLSHGARCVQPPLQLLPKSAMIQAVHFGGLGEYKTDLGTAVLLS